MNLKDIVKTLDLKVLNEADGLDREIKGGYVGDLLSDVIASGRPGDLWITIQVHENIIAVASLKDLAAIILAKSCNPLEETMENAEEEEVVLLQSSLTSFQLAHKLAELGVSGER